MLQPGRKYEAESGYRYGFNGQEKSIEISSEGNSYNAEFWEYDSRLGRRWNIDPIIKEDQSPYAAFNNNPIFYSDPNGLNGDGPIEKYKVQKNDNLTNIAKKFKTTVDNLVKWNNINDKNRINVGQELIVSVWRIPTEEEWNKVTGSIKMPTPVFVYKQIKKQKPTEALQAGGFMTLALVADDATGIGAADDPAIPIVAGATLIVAGAIYLDRLINGDTYTEPFHSEVRWLEEKKPIVAPGTGVGDLVVSLPPPQKITLYRGVHAGHPDFANALMGNATPWGLNGGHGDPTKHNQGNNYSIFTSWTTSKIVARIWATSNGPGGIILTRQFFLSQTVPSPDFFREGEVLVPGITKGATVEKLK